MENLIPSNFRNFPSNSLMTCLMSSLTHLPTPLFESIISFVNKINVLVIVSICQNVCFSESQGSINKLLVSSASSVIEKCFLEAEKRNIFEI